MKTYEMFVKLQELQGKKVRCMDKATGSVFKDPSDLTIYVAEADRRTCFFFLSEK